MIEEENNHQIWITDSSSGPGSMLGLTNHLIPPSNLIKHIFNRDNWDLEKSNNLPKITKWLQGGITTQKQSSRTLNPIF